MAQSDIIRRHYTIIHFLQMRKKATFEEIRNYIHTKEKAVNFSKRTFLRDIQDIASAYNIEILCDRKDEYTYSINRELKTDGVTQYMMEVFDLFSAFNLVNDLLKFVQPETRRPKGLNLLHPLLEAIRNKFQIGFNYEKFTSSNPQYRIAYPLGLKESSGRWYLLAYCIEKKDLRVFGLDRMTDIEITPYHFTYTSPISFPDIYKDCFGITTADKGKEPIEVVLAFTPLKGKYIKSYPLHCSQEIIKEDENEIRVKLKIHITYDFILELLKHAGDVSIIQPNELKSRYVYFLKRGLELNS